MSMSQIGLGGIFNSLDCSPWGMSSGRFASGAMAVRNAPPRPGVDAPLYTPEERRRRDASPWTLVQGILAPVQFAVFAVSLVLVLRYLATGHGYQAATVSIVAKTFALYAIMLTGSIWEREVFGRYLFAPAFFWEDMFSLLVLGLHTAYLAALATGSLGASDMMLLALAAYASYLVNAAQFVMKLRTARKAGPSFLDATPDAA